MKKIRSCQEYPVIRALRLIEAISRDLLEQINKVLSPRAVIHTSNIHRRIYSGVIKTVEHQYNTN